MTSEEQDEDEDKGDISEQLITPQGPYFLTDTLTLVHTLNS